MNNRYDKPCFACCLKHLGQAAVLVDEAINGYPAHWHLAVGHMAEAESEVLGAYQDLSKAIRKVRKQVQSKNRPDFLHLFNLVEEIAASRVVSSKISTSLEPRELKSES